MENEQILDKLSYEKFSLLGRVTFCIQSSLEIVEEVNPLTVSEEVAPAILLNHDGIAILSLIDGRLPIQIRIR